MRAVPRELKSHSFRNGVELELGTEMDPGTSSLSPKASQETFISLLQLEPEPIHTPPATDKDLPPLPEDAAGEDQRPAAVKSTSTSSLGLSGSGHGAIYYCKSPSANSPSKPFNAPTKNWSRSQ